MNVVNRKMHPRWGAGATLLVAVAVILCMAAAVATAIGDPAKPPVEAVHQPKHPPETHETHLWSLHPAVGLLIAPLVATIIFVWVGLLVAIARDSFCRRLFGTPKAFPPFGLAGRFSGYRLQDYVGTLLIPDNRFGCWLLNLEGQGYECLVDKLDEAKLVGSGKLICASLRHEIGSFTVDPAIPANDLLLKIKFSDGRNEDLTFCRDK